MAKVEAKPKGNGGWSYKVKNGTLKTVTLLGGIIGVSVLVSLWFFEQAEARRAEQRESIMQILGGEIVNIRECVWEIKDAVKSNSRQINEILRRLPDYKGD